MRSAIAIVPLVVAFGCSTGSHARDSSDPVVPLSAPEPPTGGVLDGHILAPEGFPLGRSRVDGLQEWFAPGTPDPSDLDNPPAPVPDVRRFTFGQITPANDGSFQIQMQGKGPAMIWLEFRPNELDREGGWQDPFECTLAAYLGTVDVPPTGRIDREFDARDILSGSIDVEVRLHGMPARDMRVTLFSPNHLRDAHDSWPRVEREGHQYVGGITILTGEDGHARLSHMPVGEWACYVRPLDRSWGSISDDRAIVRADGETLFGVNADASLYVLQFVSGDSTTMSPAGVMDAPTALGEIEIWWQQRTALGLLGFGHARTDADGTWTHEFPPGQFEFGIADGAARAPSPGAVLADGWSISRVNLAEPGAVPRQVYLRFP
jgi:hypothetical protein